MAGGIKNPSRVDQQAVIRFPIAEGCELTKYLPRPDIGNQVPLLDGGVTLLMFSKYETQKMSTESSGVQTPVPSNRDLKLKVGIPSDDAGVDNQVTENLTEKNPGFSVPSFLRNLLSADTMLSGSDTVKANDLKHRQWPDRSLRQEKDGNLITSYIPPSFSMLQEQAEEITRHPSMLSSKKKISITRVHTSQGSKPKTPPEPMSLFEKFKQKSQESVQSDKSFIYKESGHPSRGQSSPSLPSHLGVEDISKSPLDLKDEQANRRLWDRMREKAWKEQEEKKNT